MPKFSFCLVWFFLLASVQTPSQDAWRSLKPLVSTRSDVERVLGAPDQNFENRLFTYYLAQFTLSIGFSANPKCKESVSYDTWDARDGTMTAIKVFPKKGLSLDEAGVDLKGFIKREMNSDLREHFYYSNVDEGLSIEVRSNQIVSYIYEPKGQMKHLRCTAQ
jgi:hypothetical protein